MVEVLDAEIGGLRWVADPVQMGASRSGCSTGGAITEAQEVETLGPGPGSRVALDAAGSVLATSSDGVRATDVSVSAQLLLEAARPP